MEYWANGAWSKLGAGGASTDAAAGRSDKAGWRCASSLGLLLGARNSRYLGASSSCLSTSEEYVTSSPGLLLGAGAARSS